MKFNSQTTHKSPKALRPCVTREYGVLGLKNLIWQLILQHLLEIQVAECLWEIFYSS